MPDPIPLRRQQPYNLGLAEAAAQAAPGDQVVHVEETADGGVSVEITDQPLAAAEESGDDDAVSIPDEVCQINLAFAFLFL